MMSFIGLMTMFLAWNLQEVTGGQTTVALSCGLFTSSRREPIELNLVSVSRSKEILEKLLTCGEADSQIGIDEFYFSYHGISDELTGLMAAILYRFNDVARTLIHYTRDLNLRNKQGWSALHWAASMGNNDLLKIILDFGGDVNSMSEDFSFTPLMIAASTGADTTASILIARGASVDQRTVNGNTALIFAASGGQMSSVALLLEHGADKHKNSNGGLTAEDNARENNHDDVANFIRNYR